MKNRGKESYQNISLPEGLSAAVEKGLERGRRYRRKRLFVTAGSLAAACAAAAVVFMVLPGDGLLRGTDVQEPSAAELSYGATDHLPAAAGNDASLPDVSREPADESFGGYDDDSAFLQDAAGETPADLAEVPGAAEDAGMKAPSSVQVSGIVTEISDEQIVLENTEEAATGQPSSWALHITEGTAFLAADTLEKKEAADIRVGDRLYAYISPNMTRSIPPISNAFALFSGGDEETVLPACAVITEISSDEKGNLLIFLDQDLILIPGPETLIRTADQETSLKASDLKVGDRILASYQIVTMSIPAQTNPELILLLPKTDGI